MSRSTRTALQWCCSKHACLAKPRYRIEGPDGPARSCGNHLSWFLQAYPPNTDITIRRIL